MIATVLNAGRQKILVVAVVMIALIAIADWLIGLRASLGVLYIFPMLLVGTRLPILYVFAVAVLCAFLRSCFDLPSPLLEVFLRFIFASLSYSSAGLLVIALIRNRQEQELRQEAEEQLNVLAETSPAAILTLDQRAFVIAANRAAVNLLMIPDGQELTGRSISGYVPVLADALKLNNSLPSGLPGLCTSAQGPGRRDNGEIFLANTWFSLYSSPGGKRLAAIVVDASEEMRDREEQSLSQLIRGNRIAAAAVSHEVRNLCSAIAMVSSSLQVKASREQEADVHSLTSLVSGLERIADSELRWQASDAVEPIALQSVLDDLRIVIEPAWREVEGRILWQLPTLTPTVLADRRGLLQAFLNLAQNSLRAVQECQRRELTIVVSREDNRAVTRFFDTGPGIAAPERLFEPFQPGADGSGIGLYVSRAVIRGYGGDLRVEPVASGSCFVVEVQSVSQTQ